MEKNLGLGFNLLTGTDRKSNEKARMYAVAAETASDLLTRRFERVNFSEREREIKNVVEQILTENYQDEVGKREASVRIARLLRTDPLTDQETGAIVRFQRLLYDDHYDLIEQDPKVDLTSKELLTIQGGDYNQIKIILSKIPERKKVFRKALAGWNNGDDETVVYRGMWIDEDEANLIREFGIVPAGLAEYGTLEGLIEKTLWGYGIWKNDGYSRRERLEKIFFTKVNVLHDVYESYEFGATSLWKLGISTTTGKNLISQRGRFFGDHIIEIRLPQSRLITHKNAGDSEDEKTIMYYIPPSAIMGIYKITDNYYKGTNYYKSTMQLLEEAKAEASTIP